MMAGIVMKLRLRYEDQVFVDMKLRELPGQKTEVDIRSMMRIEVFGRGHDKGENYGIGE